jgi:tetratricopeptide (TPR) repeat protein
MARADRRSARRTRATPGIRASGQAGALEQTLFFTRLRRQAKWIFLLLAIIFGGSFVFFGVGSEVGGGIADILQGRAPGSGPSVSEARERVEERPRDADALRDLVTALQNEGQPDEAIQYLERYSRVRSSDTAALRELAGLYLGQAGRHQGEAQRLQTRLQLLTPETSFLPPPTSPLGEALGDSPITSAVQQDAQAAFTDALTRMQDAFRSAQEIYQRLVVLEPEDANLQLQLADAALNAGDAELALASYRRFLELAPDDPQAPLVEQEIARLEASVGLGTTG